MYRYKLDVAIADPTVEEDVDDKQSSDDERTIRNPLDDGTSKWEPLVMSFLLFDPYDQRDDILFFGSEVERIGAMIEEMPLGEKAVLSLALLSGEESRSARLYFECRQLSDDDVKYLTRKAKLDVFMTWGAEVRPQL